MKNRIRIARGTSAARSVSTEVPAEGQPVYETDTKQLYVGDGTTPLKDLIAGKVILTDTCDNLSGLYALLNNHTSDKILEVVIDLGTSLFSGQEDELRYYQNNSAWGWGPGAGQPFGAPKVTQVQKGINGRYNYSGKIGTSHLLFPISYRSGTLTVDENTVHKVTYSSEIPNTSAAYALIYHDAVNIQSPQASGTITVYYTK